MSVHLHIGPPAAAGGRALDQVLRVRRSVGRAGSVARVAALSAAVHAGGRWQQPAESESGINLG